MRAKLLAAGMILVASAAAVQAGDKPSDKERAIAAGNTPPATYKAVLDCRAIADPGQRLACFDRSVASLATATDARDVVILDRATIRETKRGLFGIALPSIKLFGGNDDEEVQQIESTIASASYARDGFAVFALPDGARWKQTEGRDVWAKAGQTIVIRKGALGGYMASVNGQGGIRVIRLQQ